MGIPASFKRFSRTCTCKSGVGITASEFKAISRRHGCCHDSCVQGLRPEQFHHRKGPHHRSMCTDAPCITHIIWKQMTSGALHDLQLTIMSESSRLAQQKDDYRSIWLLPSPCSCISYILQKQILNRPWHLLRGAPLSGCLL